MGELGGVRVGWGRSAWGRVGTIGALALGAAVVCWLLAECGGLRVNTTPSMPKGLYRFALGERAAAGDVALVCAPATPFGPERTSGSRGVSRLDRCAAGRSPVLKRVVATAGACIDRSGDQLTIDGRPVARLAEGAPFEYWAGRCLEAGEVWVHGSHPASWDSRYYGPLRESAVLGRVRALWIWTGDEGSLSL